MRGRRVSSDSYLREGNSADLQINAVGVAQLVERWIVAPVVEGSIPFTHPSQKNASRSNAIG